MAKRSKAQNQATRAFYAAYGGKTAALSISATRAAARAATTNAAP